MQQIHACVVRRSATIIMLAAISLPISSVGQILPPILDTTTIPDHVSFGVTRVAFTSVFHGDAALNQPILGGILTLRQQYRGASLLVGTISFRDDELFRAEWRYPVGSTVSLFPRFEWDVSNDTRSLGIAKLERLRTAGGIAWEAPWGVFRAIAGYENADQLGVREGGSVVGGEFYSAQQTIGDIGMSIGLRGERVRLRVRTNADLNGRIELASTNSASTFRLRIEHQRQQRDYYTTLGISSTIALEHRTEQRWIVSGELYQNLWEWLSLTVVPDIQIANVERFFDAAVASSALTYVRRKLDEVNGSVRAVLAVASSVSDHRLELFVGNRTESNATFDQFQSPTPQLVEELRQSERMRDNRWQFLQISTVQKVAVTDRDTISVDASSRIVRYDTPSALNYDDRDELSLLARASLRRRWSNALASSATLEYAATHFVFLRAQRSALSNWNRSVRLAWTFQSVLGALTWYPSFEILAQYTSYDFEGRVGVPTSFSFRQVSYRDSVRLVLPTGSIEAQLYVRWFLRGDFSWSQFAEFPTGTGTEQFIRGMYWRSSQEHSVGIGVRWYLLEQRLSAASLSQLSSSQRSIAPEAAIRLSVGTMLLELGGWYELRYLQDGQQQILPNVYLTVTRRL